MRFQSIPRLLFFWLTCLAFPLITCAERLPIRIYTSADGLGSSFVDYLMRDSRGFMWFCTRDGLSRFDGSRFVTYRIGDKNSPPGIEGITETSGGVYWLTTTNGFYRFKADAVSHPNQTSGNRPFLNAQFITPERGSIFEDRAGTLWYLGDDLYRINERDGKIEFQEARLKLPAHPNRPLVIFQILEADDECFWITTNLGLVRRLPDGRIFLYQHETDFRLGLVSLIRDTGGHVWVVWGNDLFVVKPPPLSSLPAFDNFHTQPLEPTSILSTVANPAIVLPEKPGEILRLVDGPVNGQIKRFYQTVDGHVWLGANDQLAEFDGRFLKVHDAAEGFPSGMGVMAEDGAGNLWIGGQTGLARLDRGGLTSYGQADGMDSGNVQAISEGADGTLYFATGNYHISRFGDKGFHTVRPQVPLDARALWTSRYAFLSSANEWWILTAAGVYQFAAANLQKPLATYDISTGLKADEAFQVFEDSRGDIWLSQQPAKRENSGLYRMKRGQNKFESFSAAEGLPAGLSAESFAEDRQGNLWFGFYEGGLVRFANGRFEEFTTADGLPSGLITDLHVDRRGRLWLTSALSGVTRIDEPNRSKPEFVSLKTDNGLSSNNVRTITEDHFGNIYVGTARGVDRISPETNRVKHYSVSDGLAGDFVVDSHCDKQGVLWFATRNGLSRLVPSAAEDHAPPTVWLGGLRIAGEAQAVSELGDAQIQTVALVHTQNNLQIDFFGLDFRAGETLRYQFQLEGADSGWGAPTEQRTVTYANLKPGTYRFMVRALTTDGGVSEKPAILSFKILPPIWLRWWFLALVSVLMLALLYAFYRYRMAHLRAVNAALREANLAEEQLRKTKEERLVELEHVRKRIATDLHDDIGSSLTRISLLSEVSRRQGHQAETGAGGSLAVIAGLARELVDSMSDIVWAINPERDHLGDLTQRMRHFASDVLAARGSEFRFHFPNSDRDLRVGANFRRELFLIFKEAVNNVVRHSECTRVEIDFKVDGQGVFLKVMDNGRGFDAQSKVSGHGLKSMRSRIESLGGRLEIESDPAAGTTLTFVIPLGPHDGAEVRARSNAGSPRGQPAWGARK
jgi:signal transduction histidine kinase/ligand-binding sensor domain-containing protein